MSIRPLSSALQKIANDELNEDVHRIQSDLDHMWKWMEKQPYLSARVDERQLVTFLRGCKWSLQRTKDKLQNFYQLRCLLPEYFQNRDPFQPEIQNVLNKRLFIPLPKTKTPGSPRICLYKCSEMHEDISVELSSKIFFMVIDILLNEDDNFLVSGMILITDYENTPLRIVAEATPGYIKKLLVMYEKVYPVRVRNLIGINTPKIVEALFNNFLRALLNEKLRSKLLLVTSSNMDLVYDKIDKSLLPKEYGGENGSVDELARDWKKKVESYREWFLEDSKKCCDANLYFDRVKTYNEHFQMEGSFRKLIID
ncbi:hypothetical protein FQR65_LT11427 [Abscondita terminalis]|nr:hypothetical protein FQR65_LT11427 [Abscondita terminalis]